MHYTLRGALPDNACTRGRTLALPQGQTLDNVLHMAVEAQVTGERARASAWVKGAEVGGERGLLGLGRGRTSRASIRALLGIAEVRTPRPALLECQEAHVTGERNVRLCAQRPRRVPRLRCASLLHARGMPRAWLSPSRWRRSGH